MVYAYIFAGSYALFFVATSLYVLIGRNNAAAVYREAGLSQEKIDEQLATDEWKGWALARRSTLLNGSAFGFLVAIVYAVSVMVL